MTHKLIIVFLIAGLAALAVLFFVEGPELIKEQVKNLKMEQNGFDIEITWDEMDCDGYDVVITCDNQRTVLTLQENHYTIQDAILEKTYRVTVSARLKSGGNSRDAKSEITTSKLDQDVTVNLTQYEGFKDNEFRIEAEGTGDITFKSDDKDTASVNEKGLVRLHKPGNTVIRVNASGDLFYAEGTENVVVTVYPDVLDEPKTPLVKYDSYTRCTLMWNQVEYAHYYKVFKQNKHTKKYEFYRNLKTKDLSAEITRDIGKYVIKAYAKVQGKTIKSRHSVPVKVKGITDRAKSYSSAKTIKRLDRSNLEVFREIHGDGGTTVPQSLSQTKDCYVVSYVNAGGSAGKLISYSKKDGECVEIKACGNMGHANGTTYNPNTNKFYVAKTHKEYRTASCSTYKGKTKEYAGSFSLPRVTSGIAYDESNDCYYLSKGNELYVCSSNFSVQKFIHKKARYNHAQDIGAYNGIILVCTWVSGKTSYIDMYRASDGAYLGSYDVSIGEIESCVVDDGYLIILMNTLGNHNDFIYKTKERIAIPE